ncbi:MAG TPA: chemotaxis protein CheX [Bryobacteraceae bacterium]|nr:chemotaxis protein CheX [Bryobacteraceae bacterium]
MATMTDAGKKMITDSNLVEAIQRATREVFSMMLGMEIEPGDPFTGTSAGTESGVLALVGLAGPWMGTGSITCTPRLACRLASQMLMAEYAAVDDEVLDAVAEVANMVIGNVKTELERIVGPMALSTPTVIYGHNFETRRIGGQEWISVPFPCDGQELRVQLCLAPAREPRATLGPGFALPHTVQM